MFKAIAAQLQVVTLCLLLGLCLTGPARAQETLVSSDVAMDETGLDANDARAQAMKKAEREGLDKLLEKLAPEQRVNIMKKLEDNVISSMVKSVEVLDEKISGNRYRASLRVNYNALAVDTLVDKKQAADAPPPPTSTSVLVIPVYSEENKSVLWEPVNPWRDAWRRAILEVSGGNVLAPYGDSIDAAVVNAESVQAANYAALIPFFTRYGVGQVVIVKAIFEKSVENGKDQAAGIQVVRRNVGTQRSETFVVDYRADPGEDKMALLYRAAHDMIEQVSHQRSEQLNQAAVADLIQGTLTILVPTTTLDSWTKTRKSLGTLQTIIHMDIIAISPQQVDVSIQFKGPKTSLAHDITALGLRVQQYDNYWVVSRE